MEETLIEKPLTKSELEVADIIFAFKAAFLRANGKEKTEKEFYYSFQSRRFVFDGTRYRTKKQVREQIERLNSRPAFEQI